MKIVVCIKQVPDTAEVKLDPKTNTLIREGVPSIINHDDKAGLEAALRLREQVGGTVTVVCMGPPQADVALREALAMGADDAYLLSAREFGGSDTYATATIIAAALKKIGFDLVITGRQAIDGDTAQVGPQIAEQLGVPQVSYAEELTLEEKLRLFLTMSLRIYHVPEAELEGAIRFVEGLDIRGIAEQVMQKLFKALAMRYEFSLTGLTEPGKE